MSAFTYSGTSKLFVCVGKRFHEYSATLLIEMLWFSSATANYSIAIAWHICAHMYLQALWMRISLYKSVKLWHKQIHFTHSLKQTCRQTCIQTYICMCMHIGLAINECASRNYSLVKHVCIYAIEMCMSVCLFVCNFRTLYQTSSLHAYALCIELIHMYIHMFVIAVTSDALCLHVCKNVCALRLSALN